jgi:hypothetical protein
VWGEEGEGGNAGSVIYRYSFHLLSIVLLPDVFERNFVELFSIHEQTE